MRGSQFLVLINMLRDELRRSTDPAVSSSDVDSLKRVINRNYEFLYSDYDWPILRRVYPSALINAGQQLYDLPEDLDPERIESVAIWYGAIARSAIRGIGFEQYNIFDPEDDIRSSPVTHWDLRSSALHNHVQFELWPLPDTTLQYVQFIGFKSFERLVNDIDQCLLDDNLVVAFSASEMLTAQGSADAEAKFRAAQAMYSRMRGRLKGAGKTYTLTDSGNYQKAYPKVVVQVNR
jgi:hypothetical protein